MARAATRVHVVGHVGGGAAGGEVGVVAQDDALALHSGTDSGVRPCWTARDGDVVEADLGQRGGVAVAATRGSLLTLSTSSDGQHAIAHDLRRVAAGGGHELVAHHQQAGKSPPGQELSTITVPMFGGLVGGVPCCAW